MVFAAVPSQKLPIFLLGEFHLLLNPIKSLKKDLIGEGLKMDLLEIREHSAKIREGKMFSLIGNAYIKITFRFLSLYLKKWLF